MAKSDQVELFVDINCPFCFCQTDRVVRLEVEASVVWRGIEHAPELPVPATRDHPLVDDIDDELRKLAAREENFAIRDPRIRPNTRSANAWLVAMGRSYPQKQWAAVHALGVALWREGLDVSRADVRRGVAEKLGLDDVEPTEEDVATAARHTATWTEGPFERRLPSARSPHGAVLLGLNNEERFRLFVQSGLFSGRRGESC